MITRKVQYIILLSIVSILAACTSTNAPTANTNPNYASQYQQGTRSAQVASTKEETKKPVEIDQTVTLMQMSFEVGEILPGQSYNVFARVDNPANRSLRYHWRASSGVLENASDEDQTRILNMLSGKPADTTTGGVTVTESKPIPRPSNPSVATSDNKSQITEVPTPKSRTRSASNLNENKLSESEEETKSIKNRTTSKNDTEESNQEEINNSTESEKAQETSEEPQEKTNDESVKPEETKETPAPRTKNANKKIKAHNKQENKNGKKSIYKTFEDEDNSNNDQKVNSKEDKKSNSELKPGKRTITEGVASRAGEAVSKAATERIQSRAGSLEPKRLGSSEDSLAADDSMEAPPIKEPDKEGRASGRSMEFRTTVPVVRWTAAGLGKVTIKLLITDEKGQEVAGPRELEFQVTPPKPKLVLDFDRAQELTEDAFVTLNLKGYNLKDFRKGLVTINFSQEFLSFRYAKIGNFFPNAAQTNFFYAQPDPKSGTITAAFSFDDETRMAEGDGLLASFTFKMRKNAEKPEDINFSLTPGPTNVYILDSTGTDTLPPLDFKPEIIANNLIEPKSKTSAAQAGAETTSNVQEAQPTTPGTETGQTGQTQTPPATPPTATRPENAPPQAPGQTQAPPSASGGSTTNPPPPSAVNPPGNPGTTTPPTPTENLPSTAKQVGPGIWQDSATQYYYVFNPISKQYLPFRTLEEAQRVKVDLDRTRS